MIWLRTEPTSAKRWLRRNCKYDQHLLPLIPRIKQAYLRIDLYLRQHNIDQKQKYNVHP